MYEYVRYTNQCAPDWPNTQFKLETAKYVWRYKMEKFQKESCVRDYHIHVYKDIWNPAPGEKLQSQMETGNSSDLYTVAVMKDSTIVGPWSICMCTHVHSNVCARSVSDVCS